jgi:hypothetical protein
LCTHGQKIFEYEIRKLEGPEVKIVSVRISIAMLILCALIVSPSTQATVFISEVFINPPGDSGFDVVREFIELAGTPGMKLDGYAIAVLNGTQSKFYPLGSIPPIPDPAPEIDEFFSLDGLALGDNGILALLVTNPRFDRYPELFNSTTDAHWINWNGLWNGGLDVPGTINNDGSTTIFLIRNRPGITEADPANPAGLLWGKTIMHDYELIDGGSNDQWGDGNIDRGQPNGMGGTCLDLSGLTTVGDLSDDLEIVDEVSFEDDAGWEYDTDGRHVDEGSTHPGFPHRHVHSLDNPIGFNPDALTRVDYRTTGNGWLPSGGGTGEMTNGNNWQDTATEQWIRGGSEGPAGYPPHFYYDIASNPTNPIQPYETNVPLWLNDGTGQDFDFGTRYSYWIAAGFTNPLCVPFIPGDVDRDGVCDANDIAKIKAVFGDDDWIFSNSFLDAPETDRGDPATQTKPWDVDGTGDNGIEASDMQWVLNFQEDTTGHIVGIRYDSSTPASSGVVLNSNAGTECTVTTLVNIPGGRTLSTLIIGDIVEITVSSQVTAGANTTGGQENGIMQFVHDVTIASGGVIKVVWVEPLGSFNTTRASIQLKQGTDGDLGMNLINGYTTSFTQGTSGSAQLYRITLETVSAGSTNISIGPAASAKFASSTPHGIKIGHTDHNGTPASSVPASPISVTSTYPGDFDSDDDVDLADLSTLTDAWLGSDNPPTPNWNPDCDISNPADGVINMADFSVFAGYWQE